MKNSGWKHRYNLFVLIIFIIFLQACGGQGSFKGSGFKEDDALRDLWMVVNVRDDIITPVPHNSAMQYQYGAFGVALYALFEKWFEEDVAEDYKDVMESLSGADYKAEFANALEEEMAAVPWIDLKKVDAKWGSPADYAVSMSDIKRSIESDNLRSGLFVYADAWISGDYRCLKLNVTFKVYRDLRDLDQKYESQSCQSICLANPTDDVCLDWWLVEDAALFKSEMVKAINALAIKVRKDLTRDKDEVLEGRDV